MDHWHNRLLSARLVKPVLPCIRDNTGHPRLPSLRVSIELSAHPSSSGDPPTPPPPGCTLFPHSTPLQLVSLWVGEEVILLCFLSAWDRNTLAISIGPDPLVVQLASLVGFVKFSNWLIWLTNVSQGSLIVSIGHIGVYSICSIAISEMRRAG